MASHKLSPAPICTMYDYNSKVVGVLEYLAQEI